MPIHGYTLLFTPESWLERTASLGLSSVLICQQVYQQEARQEISGRRERLIYWIPWSCLQVSLLGPHSSSKGQSSCQEAPLHIAVTAGSGRGFPGPSHLHLGCFTMDLGSSIFCLLLYPFIKLSSDFLVAMSCFVLFCFSEFLTAAKTQPSCFPSQ